MAAQRMPQQQHNNSQNASSSQCNIPGSYEQSQVTPSGAHNEQASRPMLGAESRLVPSASINDRNGAQAQAVDPGLENTQVNQSKNSFALSTVSVTDCIAPAHNLFRSDSEHKPDIVDKTLEEKEDEQSGDNLGAPRVDVGVSLLPTFQMVQPARADDESTGLVNSIGLFDIYSYENQPYLLSQGVPPFADDTLGRSLSSATSSSQNKGALAGSLHISDGATGLASSSPAFEECVLPAASQVSQSLQPCAQRTTERDQVSEQLSSENAPVIDHNAGRAEQVPVFQQPEFDQDNAAQDRDLSEAVPLDDDHVDYAVHDAQAANAILQPEILEFDRNDYIDLAQARAERNHNAPARASRRRQYYMNADGDIDIFLARQEWILGHLCLSCREKNKEVMMVPCGHSVLCWPCFLEASRFSEQINRCPRCMQPTSGIKLSQDCYRRVLQLSHQ